MGKRQIFIDSFPSILYTFIILSSLLRTGELVLFQSIHREIIHLTGRKEAALYFLKGNPGEAGGEK